MRIHRERGRERREKGRAREPDTVLVGPSDRVGGSDFLPAKRETNLLERRNPRLVYTRSDTPFFTLKNTMKSLGRDKPFRNSQPSRWVAMYIGAFLLPTHACDVVDWRHKRAPACFGYLNTHKLLCALLGMIPAPHDVGMLKNKRKKDWETTTSVHYHFRATKPQRAI